jgi:hypothetical protein
MEVLVVLVMLVGGFLIYGLAYKAGKREGSRKGYGVGFARGKRSAKPSGCALVVLCLLAGLVLVGQAIAAVLLVH